MKKSKLIATVSALTMMFSMTATSLTSFAATSITDYDIVVGYVEEDEPITSYGIDEKKYTLDFSCLDISIDGEKIVSRPDLEKIDKVSKAKSFNLEKKDKLIKSSQKTQELLENELSDPKVHKELIEIINQNLEQTSQMPVIALTEAPYEDSNIGSKEEKSISPLISGPEEGNSIRLYTSVSGSGSSVWGQTNTYIKNPTLVGVAMYCPDNVSLSWDSPWKLSNNYTLKLVDMGGQTIPTWLKPVTRTGGSNSCLAYSYAQESVRGAYLGATLNNGTRGGHNLFSRYIRTKLNLSYSFSGGSGKTGVSVSPSVGTSSVDSSVYFSN
ncbi:hypothetical protein [Clostridium baratii]|uniref:hypothetical protein n=1 Tax=Clostridium baratii TaxID=1561 RepID=UPI0005F29D4E|nr:hypothetical protein [Clostridium baratii]AQM58537.1 hypothetical protein NPD11_3050 [Clostridium baratii]KJU70407.1 hypothetical protein UC77_15000 [Clostridium baratii]